MAESFIQKVMQGVKNQRETFKYITTDSKGNGIAVPFGKPEYSDDMMVFIVDKDYNGTSLSLHTKSDKIPPEFAWAKERFEQAQTEWDKIVNSDARPLTDNFRQRGGVLVINTGEADHIKYQNALRKELGKEVFPLTQGQKDTKTGGATVTYPPEKDTLHKYVISLSVSELSPTDMIHELTHAGDGGCSHSKLFEQCWKNDMNRGSSIVRKIHDDMKVLVGAGAYSEEKVPQEMLCRLTEMRHKYPDIFKKTCPYVEAFLTKVFYPALRAQTAAVNHGEKVGNQEATGYLADINLLSGKYTLPTPAEQQKREEDRSREYDPIGDEVKKVTDLDRRIVIYTSEIEKYKKEGKDATGLVEILVEDKQQRQELATKIPALKEAARKVLAPQIDNHPSSISMMRAMDDFRHRMEVLERQTIGEHVEQIPSKEPISHTGISGRLGGITDSQGQGGEQPLDKHNGLDYRDVGGKDRKPDTPEPIRPTNSLEAERQRKREEVRRNLGWNNDLVAKRGHSL